jgi:hypothetical protein
MAPFGHIAGIPVEETLGTLGPAATIFAGAAMIAIRRRWKRLRHARQAPLPSGERSR